jgi:hypothetical protein
MLLHEGEVELNILEKSITDIEQGEGLSYQNLTMFPLFGTDNSPFEYITLDDAFASGSVKVSEISDSGSVSEINLQNHGSLPVFMLDGEELVGAKQNRILNLSILAPADQSIEIPVSCVEQGRWAYHSDEFSSSNRAHYSKGRARKAHMVSRSLESGARARTDQQEIWRDLDEKSSAFHVKSASGAMSDIYESRTTTIDKFVKRFASQPKQIGSIFLLNNAVAGFDLFDRPRTLAKLLPKLVRSYALDALEPDNRLNVAGNLLSVAEFKESIAAATLNVFPAVGLGTDYRFAEENISGGALVFDDRLVHLSAFPAGEDKSYDGLGHRSRLARSSQRRNFH